MHQLGLNTWGLQTSVYALEIWQKAFFSITYVPEKYRLPLVTVVRGV